MADRSWLDEQKIRRNAPNRECVAQDADDHAGKLAGQHLSPLEQGNTIFKLPPQLSWRGRLVNPRRHSQGVMMVPVSQEMCGIRIPCSRELRCGQTADQGKHHYIGRAHHRRDIHRRISHTRRLKTHDLTKQPRQIQANRAERVTRDVRGVRVGHKPSIGSHIALSDKFCGIATSGQRPRPRPDP